MNGVELADALNDQYPDIRVILVSGNLSELDTAQLPDNIVTCIKKPIVRNDFIRHVDEIIKECGARLMSHLRA